MRRVIRVVIMSMEVHPSISMKMKSMKMATKCQVTQMTTMKSALTASTTSTMMARRPTLRRSMVMTSARLIIKSKYQMMLSTNMLIIDHLCKMTRVWMATSRTQTATTRTAASPNATACSTSCKEWNSKALTIKTSNNSSNSSSSKITTTRRKPIRLLSSSH